MPAVSTCCSGFASCGYRGPLLNGCLDECRDLTDVGTVSSSPSGEVGCPCMMAMNLS
ncbi:hypothetical protein HMPREF9947_2154 [Propionibacterium sp. 409-HC1]|nr:hypothetical protein HMPREF9947_2154 [Propionibacterium sp. 409-HC1]